MTHDGVNVIDDYILQKHIEDQHNHWVCVSLMCKFQFYISMG